MPFHKRWYKKKYYGIITFHYVPTLGRLMTSLAINNFILRFVDESAAFFLSAIIHEGISLGVVSYSKHMIKYSIGLDRK